jgi:hypothetical protein
MAIERSYLEAHSIMVDCPQTCVPKHLSEPPGPVRPCQVSITPVTLNFHDGISLLKEDGWMKDDENLNDYEGFSKRAEVRLGQLAKTPTITS